MPAEGQILRKLDLIYKELRALRRLLDPNTPPDAQETRKMDPRALGDFH